MKNKQAVVLLFIANIISGLAQGITMIAIPWYFVEVVDKPEFFASAYLIITFLTFFWGLFAGTLIDRYSRKKIFIILNLICGVFIGSIALFGNHFPSFSDFLVVSVFTMTIFNYNIHYPNLYALGQEITEKKYYGKLNSYIEVQGQVTSVLAGAFAAILLTGTTANSLDIAGFSFALPFNIEPWHIYDIFFIDALTYIAVIFIFSLIYYQPISINKIDKSDLYERLFNGIKYLQNNSPIFIFGICSYMLFAFTLVEIHVVLPSYVHDFLKMDGNVYASAEIYYSFGAIFSGFLILRIFRSFPIVSSVVVLMLVVSCAFYSFAMYDVLWLFFLGNFILGITNAGVRILRTTYLFNHVPNNLIGRVGSVFNSLNIMIRMCLILTISLPFFNLEDNIRYAYIIGVLLMLISVIFLLIWYRKIILVKELK